MKSFLIDIITTYLNSEEGQRQLSNLYDMRGHSGWKAHQSILMLIIERIGNEMLSQRFTKLDPAEKDVRQRVYNSMYEVIKFLIDPLKATEATRKIKRHNKAMEATVRKRPERK